MPRIAVPTISAAASIVASAAHSSRVFAWLVATALFAAMPLPFLQARAADWDLSQLMQALAQHSPQHARFVEKKTLAVLKNPLESSGELFFTQPGKLEKRTEKPKAEVLVLDGDTLTIVRDGKTRSIALQSYAEVGTLIGSIRAALGGDRTLLERSFRLDLTGGRSRWQLAMLPSDRAIAALIDRIVLRGGGDRVEVIETVHANGDREVMTITPLAD